MSKDEMKAQYASEYTGKWMPSDKNQTAEEYRSQYAGRYADSKDDFKAQYANSAADYKGQYGGNGAGDSDRTSSDSVDDMDVDSYDVFSTPSPFVSLVASSKKNDKFLASSAASETGSVTPMVGASVVGLTIGGLLVLFTRGRREASDSEFSLLH